MDDNLKKLEKLLSLMDSQTLTKEDFIAQFEKVVNLVLQIEKRTSAAVDDLEKTYKMVVDKLQGDHSQAITDLKGQTNELFVGDKLKEMRQLIDAKIASVKDGKDGKDGRSIKGDKGDPGKPGSPDKPEEIVKKLESLKGENRLDVSAIKGLDSIYEDVSKLKGRPVYVGGAGGHGQVKAHDLSDSLDGVTTTFALPAFWRVISVHLSSVPNILRPTTDYTTDGTTMQITFTSEINAATSLAAGQTLLIVYAEA